jgi:hypothetical protein
MPVAAPEIFVRHGKMHVYLHLGNKKKNSAVNIREIGLGGPGVLCAPACCVRQRFG